MIKRLVIVSTAILISACAGPQITRVQPVSDSADIPYSNVLVISVFESFDVRRYLEQDIVKQLSERGVKAVASTSLMNTKTPMVRETFLAMVESQGSDAVLVTKLTDFESKTKVLDASPEATHILRPTYYYNVWSVELTEFVGPQDLQSKHSIVLSTQLYSVSSKLPVWAIESSTKLTRDHQNRGDVSFIADEAKAIVNYLAKDGLLAR